jgi:TetR/AcrR family transcriptional regulator, repressor of fatR-cypB operon
MESTLSRRDRERRRRRQDMLDAAKAVFAEKGYSNATVDEIAQRAEYGKGTLYNYFEGGKEDLLFAIFDELYDDVYHLTAQAFLPEKLDGTSIRDAFSDYFEASLLFFLERRELFMLLIKVAHRMMFSEEAHTADYFKRQRDRLVAAIEEPLERAIARGELRPLPACGMAHMIMGSINGFQAHLCMEQCDDGDAASRSWQASDSARFLTTVLFDGLLVRHMDAATIPSPEDSSDAILNT